GYFKFNTGSSEMVLDSSAIGGRGKTHTTRPEVTRVKSGALSGPPPGKSVIATNALDFGEREVTDGPTPSKAFSIGNEGKGQLVVVRAAVEGKDAGEFVLARNKAKGTVEPGQSQQLKIAFAPLSAGKKTATLKVETNDPERLVSVILLSGNARLERAPMAAHSPIPSDTSKVFAWMPLRWARAAGADAYKLYLWKDGAAKPARGAASLSKTRFTPDSYLDYEATYHWQVIAENKIGSTAGPVWTFTTEQENPETALPFDISPKAQRARKVIYEVPGRARLSGKETRLKKNNVISIFGDSITHINGYVSNIQKCLSASPFTSKLNVRAHNRGLNGGEIEHLRDGGKMYGDSQEPFDAVLAKDRPTVVVIYIGFNDFRSRPGTTVEDFDAIMRDLVSRSRKAGAKVVLATISVFGEKPDGRSRNDRKIDQYAEATRQVASDTGSPLVDLRKVYLAYLRNNNFELQPDGTLKFPHNRILTYDSIHPNRAGNELLADHIANGIAEALKP
ncbi:MAG: GDSL-type esterase/lipase family protein, partial [Planctomycetota bacterium]|nr:GDSL-type esterase/lipase family protein [Planctomycetota bacterium]